jgi:hypothetical protein
MMHLHRNLVYISLFLAIKCYNATPSYMIVIVLERFYIVVELDHASDSSRYISSTYSSEHPANVIRCLYIFVEHGCYLGYSLFRSMR